MERQCKLNTLELAPKGTGEGVGKQRLGQSREVFEQHVAVGENTDGDSAQVLVLSDDDLADFIHQLLEIAETVAIDLAAPPAPPCILASMKTPCSQEDCPLISYLNVRFFC